MECRLGASIAVGLALNTDAALRRMDVCNWDHPLVVEVQRAGVCLMGSNQYQRRPESNGTEELPSGFLLLFSCSRVEVLVVGVSSSFAFDGDR